MQSFVFFCLFVFYWKLWIWDTSCVLYYKGKMDQNEGKIDKNKGKMD